MDGHMNLAELRADLHRLRGETGARDARMQKISTVRTPGGLRMVYPDMFPDDGAFSEPMVANMVDIAARDIAEVTAPLPAFNCSSSMGISDRARAAADKRTKIVNAYAENSRLQIQMFTAVDRYFSYGFVPAIVRLDTENQGLRIQFLDSMGTYTRRDSWGNVKRLYQVKTYTRDDALAKFPELGGLLDRRNHGFGEGGTVELVIFHDCHYDGVFANVGDGQMVRLVPNPIGKVCAHVFSRPGLADEEYGQYDDVLAVQVAKARFALLTMEAAQKAVQAPIALPMDVQELSIGPDSILKSSSPERIRRIGLDVPQSAFLQQRDLDMELRQGARYPDVRTGNTDASIVTGRGVQALMGGFDTQVKTAQTIFADGFRVLLARCLELDEKVWPNRTKQVEGNANGTPYSLTYTPSKDIKGIYSVDVQYGLMAGLNPNQALVFGLQARGDRLISRDFFRRQLPFSIDAGEEEAKVDIEDLREALKQAVAAYSQALPALAQQGQDPSQILTRMAAIITDRVKGVSIEKSISEAFAPEEPPAGAEQAPPGLPGAPGAAPGGGGLGPEGLMPGVAPGQAGMAPGGQPDLQTLLAGIGRGGQPQLSATTSRRMAI
jgi:hypothetical protein